LASGASVLVAGVSVVVGVFVSVVGVAGVDGGGGAAAPEGA